jgi:hypothetical protein
MGHVECPQSELPNRGVPFTGQSQRPDIQASNIWNPTGLGTKLQSKYFFGGLVPGESLFPSLAGGVPL